MPPRQFSINNCRVVVSNISLFSQFSPLFGEDFQFDDHMFQRGWLKPPIRLQFTTPPKIFRSIQIAPNTTPLGPSFFSAGWAASKKKTQVLGEVSETLWGHFWETANLYATKLFFGCWGTEVATFLLKRKVWCRKWWVVFFWGWVGGWVDFLYSK